MNKLLSLLAATIVLISCQNPPEQPTKAQHWFKGNTHSHTILCGHADTHPDTVALWYLERGYHFLILSEHDQFIDPQSVNLPADRREDFILIPGQEVSDHNHIHSTAMNIDRVVHPNSPDDSLKLVNDPHFFSNVPLMQRQVDSTISAGGKTILNHPNFGAGLPAKDIQQVERLNMFELYNGHPQVFNWGTDELPSMEEKWDSLLTAGNKMYGVSSDDAHRFKELGPDFSNPGRGWVMVRTEELSPDAITEAMSRGDFYATSGVMLKQVHINQKVYELEVDTATTSNMTRNSFVMGFKQEGIEEGYRIEFISDGGKVIKSVQGISAHISPPTEATYLRAKVTYTVKRSSFTEQFFAWTQPVFLGKQR